MTDGDGFGFLAQGFNEIDRTPEHVQDTQSDPKR